jgi:PmbA protein
MEKINDYLVYAEQLMAEIKKRYPAAGPVEIVLGRNTQIEMEIRNGNTESLEHSRSQSLSVTLAMDNRRAGFSTNDLTPESVYRILSNTAEAIPYLDEDPFYRLPEPEFLGTADLDLDEDDESAFNKAEIDELLGDVEELEKLGLKQDKKFISNGAYATLSRSELNYISSAGFSGRRTRTIFRKGLGLVAPDETKGENSGRKQSASYYTVATHRDDMESNEELARMAAERVIRKLGAVKPGTGTFPVIFSPETARSILGALESAVNGHSLYRQASFLLNKKGEKIANGIINIVDNPLLPRYLGSRLFDDEGVKAAPLAIVKNGVLENYLLDSYSAAKLNTRTNGRKGGSTNFILEKGPHSEEDLIASVSDGVYLTELSGQGINIITGEYSRGAQGVWIKNGKLSHAVSEFTINSNLKEMLMNIQMVADNTDLRSSYLTPSILIGEMSVAGR